VESTDRLFTDGEETDVGADLVERGPGCDVAQVVDDFEFTISTGTLGMELRSSASNQSANRSE